MRSWGYLRSFERELQCAAFVAELAFVVLQCAAFVVELAFVAQRTFVEEQDLLRPAGPETAAVPSRQERQQLTLGPSEQEVQLSLRQNCQALAGRPVRRAQAAAGGGAQRAAPHPAYCPAYYWGRSFPTLEIKFSKTGLLRPCYRQARSRIRLKIFVATTTCPVAQSVEE